MENETSRRKDLFDPDKMIATSKGPLDLLSWLERCAFFSYSQDFLEDIVLCPDIDNKTYFKLALGTYRQALQQARVTHPDAAARENPDINAAKKSFYRFIIYANHHHTNRLYAHWQPYFAEWLTQSAPHLKNMQRNWPGMSRTERMAYFKNREQEFWQIADPDGRLFKTAKVEKEATIDPQVLYIMHDCRNNPVTENRYAGLFNPQTKNIYFVQHVIDISAKQDHRAVRHWLDHHSFSSSPETIKKTSLMNRQRIVDQPYGDFRAANTIYGHELAHKLEDLCVHGFANDPGYITQQFGFNKTHLQIHDVMRRIYDPDSKNTASYAYKENLTEVLANKATSQINHFQNNYLPLDISAFKRSQKRLLFMIKKERSGLFPNLKRRSLT